MEAKIAIYCAPHSFLKLARIRFLTFPSRIYHTLCDSEDIENGFFQIAAMRGAGSAEYPQYGRMYLVAHLPDTRTDWQSTFF